MKTSDLRQRASDDLRRDIAAAEKEIWTMRFHKGSEKAGDPNRVRRLRRDVARMQTLLRERELGLEQGAKQ